MLKILVESRFTFVQTVKAYLLTTLGMRVRAPSYARLFFNDVILYLRAPVRSRRFMRSFTPLYGNRTKSSVYGTPVRSVRIVRSLRRLFGNRTKSVGSCCLPHYCAFAPHCAFVPIPVRKSKSTSWFCFLAGPLCICSVVCVRSDPCAKIELNQLVPAVYRTHVRSLRPVPRPRRAPSSTYVTDAKQRALPSKQHKLTVLAAAAIPSDATVPLFADTAYSIVASPPPVVTPARSKLVLPWDSHCNDHRPNKSHEKEKKRQKRQKRRRQAKC